jgi:hypothetical protein
VENWQFTAISSIRRQNGREQTADIYRKGFRKAAGTALPFPAGNLWIYAAIRLNEGLEGDRIVITASDLPGNIATEEQNL